MNIQILQLAASHFPRDGEGNICATPEIISEFAELIIQECMSLTENHKHYWTQKSGSESIAEHFGIEE
jgi:hypothetical protein